LTNNYPPIFNFFANFSQIESNQNGTTVRPALSTSGSHGVSQRVARHPALPLVYAGALVLSVGSLVITLAMPLSRCSSDLYIWQVSDWPNGRFGRAAPFTISLFDVPTASVDVDTQPILERWVPVGNRTSCL
jgi:hypothetical protein